MHGQMAHAEMQLICNNYKELLKHMQISLI